MCGIHAYELMGERCSGPFRSGVLVRTCAPEKRAWGRYAKHFPAFKGRGVRRQGLASYDVDHAAAIGAAPEEDCENGMVFVDAHLGGQRAVIWLVSNAALRSAAPHPQALLSRDRMWRADNARLFARLPMPSNPRIQPWNIDGSQRVRHLRHPHLGG